MKKSSFLSVFIVTGFASLVTWGMQAVRPQSALAIPMFAKRTGASCELCHSAFPGMTNYGMMVMMSNFSMLPYHGGGDPGFTSLVYEEEFVSNPDGNPPPPKLHTENLGILNGGFIGPDFTYYLEQHVVDGGFIGGTDQLWVAYNKLFGGTGAVQFGKFHTPFPFMPAHRITLAPYATTNATIGGNDFNEDDSHWGVTLSRMQGTLMYSASLLGGNDLIGQPGAFQLLGDHNHSLDVSLMSMSDQPLNYGFGAIEGFAPAAQSRAPFDHFSRSALYLQFIPRGAQQLQLQAVGQLGFDRDPFGTGASTHQRGGFLEAQYHFSHHNWGVLRWDTQNGDAPVAGVTLDLIHQLTPNAKFTIEGRALTAGTTLGMALEWAGPWSQGNILEQPVLGSMPGMQMSGMSMPGMSMSATQMPGMSMQGGQIIGALLAGQPAAGAAKFQALNCASCHGIGGSGGAIGPRLIGLAERLQPAEIYDFIKNPRKPMPDFHLSDGDIANLVAYVVSLTPGHTVASDLAKLQAPSGSANSIPMPGMNMPGMTMQGKTAMPMSMAAPPPNYPADQPPLTADDRGYFTGIEAGDPTSGRQIYTANCQACHGVNGVGSTAPALNRLGSAYVPSYVAWHIRRHPATAVGLHLTNKQIANLTAFIETLGVKEVR